MSENGTDDLKLKISLKICVILPPTHLCPITILSTSQDSYADTLSSTQTHCQGASEISQPLTQKINCFYFAIPVCLGQEATAL